MDTSSEEEFDTNPTTFSKVCYSRAQNRNTSKNSRIQNVTKKIINREMFGHFSGRKIAKSEKFFEKIPSRLRFCLADIVPQAYLDHHAFMGFTQCGQFLLSFTYRRMPSGLSSGFREGFRFTLHFLSWVPGLKSKAKSVHAVPLFDDDAVDSHVAVSVAQWKHNPDLVVVYGISDVTERSYLSVIGVPKLGCRNCALIRGADDDELSEIYGKRCLKHNFAVHTKFYCASESSMCEPVVQLAYSNQILIYTDFIHILEIDFVKSEPDETVEDVNARNVECGKNDVPKTGSVDFNPGTPSSEVSAPSQASENVVQRILADFADYEMEICSNGRRALTPEVGNHELLIQPTSISQLYSEDWESPSPSLKNLISPPLRSPRRRPAEGLSRFTEQHRIIAEKAYEFSEDTEEPKCEKLSSYRKRRLADKKYEFSEDNSEIENIVPFRVLRSRKYYVGSTNKGLPRRPKTPPIDNVVLRVHNQISVSNQSCVTDDLPVKSESSSAIEREQTSESEYRVMTMGEDGSLTTIAVHDNTFKTLSDCIVHPNDPYLVHSGNSKCTKYFARYFVESDDDITSIITDSEDDCISGYHVALPLTAHGASYAPLQAIGAGAWDKLRSSESQGSLPPTTLRARQRSLDTELICNEVCVRLCKLNGKKFIYCFDWGCHVIDVDQSSGSLCGLCAMWFWASEKEDAGAEAGNKDCDVCRDTTNNGCLLHRRQYSAQCLFVWDLESGEYRSERVTFSEDPSQDANRVSGADRARELAMKLGPTTVPSATEHRLLTTLTGHSLKKLTDMDHCIEITKRHYYSSDSYHSPSSEEESDSY